MEKLTGHPAELCSDIHLLILKSIKDTILLLVMCTLVRKKRSLAGEKRGNGRQVLCRCYGPVLVAGEEEVWGVLTQVRGLTLHVSLRAPRLLLQEG